MSQFYDEMAAMALDLISQYGQPVQLREEKPGAYNPATGKTDPPSVKTQTAQAVMSDYKPAEFENSTLLQRGDKRLKVAAKGMPWVPSLATKVSANGETWAVIAITETNPAGTPLVYELQVRP
ncbi:hypothetical protein [Pseudomonas sp. GM_Psu_2]|uniref:hypothetical protein n=1 Tax=unclassified Pseudomonas TaxID=196821 RepID=UPI0022698B0E|nr:hypothetical protein [Pseudomonas sp. GM_Psu_2]